MPTLGQHRLILLVHFQRWEDNVVTMYKCEVALRWLKMFGQCCAKHMMYMR